MSNIVTWGEKFKDLTVILSYHDFFNTCYYKLYLQKVEFSCKHPLAQQ